MRDAFAGQEPNSDCADSLMCWWLLLLQVVQVRMMYRKFQTSDLTTGDEVLYGTLPGRFRAVKLPYKGSTIVAYAVLPDLTRYNDAGVDAAAADIGPRLLYNASLWSSMWRFGGKLEVQMPRFRITTDQIQLKQVSASCTVHVVGSCCACADGAGQLVIQQWLFWQAPQISNLTAVFVPHAC
jgi:hypothetical protein